MPTIEQLTAALEKCIELLCHLGDGTAPNAPCEQGLPCVYPDDETCIECWRKWEMEGDDG